MSCLTKRTTAYLEQELHKALGLKAAVTNRSVSEIINELVREKLVVDADDLKILQERANEPTISYEELLKDLQYHGHI